MKYSADAYGVLYSNAIKDDRGGDRNQADLFIESLCLMFLVVNQYFGTSQTDINLSRGADLK
jgi:hypothetical protein